MTRPIVLADQHHRQHDPAYELNAGEVIRPRYEVPQRVDAVLAAVEAAGLTVRPGELHGDEPVLAVHDPAMVAYLRDAYPAWRAAGLPEVMLPDTFPSPRWARGGRRSRHPVGELGWWCFDTATPLVAGSYAAARAAVDLALTGAGLVVDGHRQVYAVTRPPGHHAGPDYLGGFCVLNPAAVAARWLSGHGRVAIVDVDLHHGNGTQDVFWEDPGVHYHSLHIDPDHGYPFLSGFADELGAGPGRGANHNVPLPPDTDDERYLAALDRVLDRVARLDPAVVVVSLGYDPAANDPIGELGLTAAGFHGIGAALRELDRPLLLVQEGGYALDDLERYAAALLAGLEGR